MCKRRGVFARILALVVATLVLASCGGDLATVVGPTPAEEKDQPSAWMMAPTIAAVLAPVTIDWGGIGLSGVNPFIGFVQQHTEDGFTLVDPANATPFAFALWRPAADPFLGTGALWNTTLGGVSRLTQVNGLPFDLISIDLSEDQRRLEDPRWDVTFTGVREDGSSVSAMVTLDGVFGLEAFAPRRFTEILSLEWVSSLPVQFDNILLVPQGDSEIIVERARLKQRTNQEGPSDSFMVRGQFIAGGPIDIPNEDVTITFGTFTAAIPAGSFDGDDDDDDDDDDGDDDDDDDGDDDDDADDDDQEFEFENDRLSIEFRGNGSFSITGSDLDLSGIDPTLPVTVRLTVGNDSGSTSILLDGRGKFRL